VKRAVEIDHGIAIVPQATVTQEHNKARSRSTAIQGEGVHASAGDSPPQGRRAHAGHGKIYRRRWAGFAGDARDVTRRGGMWEENLAVVALTDTFESPPIFHSVIYEISRPRRFQYSMVVVLPSQLLQAGRTPKASTVAEKPWRAQKTRRAQRLPCLVTPRRGLGR